MISTLLAVCNAGDEVVIFEPFYENYGPGLSPERSETKIRETTPAHETTSGSGPSTKKNCAAPSTSTPKPSS